MYSRYERQKDKRNFHDRHTVFHGPTWLYPPAKIQPQRIVKWDEDSGLPVYEEIGGSGGSAAQPEEGGEVQEAAE